MGARERFERFTLPAARGLPATGMDHATKGLVALAVLTWGAAGYFAATRPPPVAPEPTVASAAPPPPAAVTASATAPLPAPPSPSACVASLLAPDTFSEPPELDSICAQPHPFKAFTALKAVVVGAAGARLTEGAKELAGLGWYELAALATIRAKCCPAPVPLEWPFALACPMDDAVAKLEAALAPDPPDDDALAAALDGYRTQAICLYKFGQGPNFGRDAMPGAEKAAFDKILARAGRGALEEPK